MREGADHVGEKKGRSQQKISTKRTKTASNAYQTQQHKTSQKEKGGRGIKNRSRKGTMDGRGERKV